jgi:hypothetical protein
LTFATRFRKTIQPQAGLLRRGVSKLVSYLKNALAYAMTKVLFPDAARL